MALKSKLSKIKPLFYYKKGRELVNDKIYTDGRRKSQEEEFKKPSRTDIINYLLSLRQNPTSYIEIGVRNPDHNFNHIKAEKKYSVDPGVEFISNPVDFKMTSDEFFSKLSGNEILSPDIRFDLIFIDGLHLADQADRDIENALQYIKDDGFVVLHDCNPPTEWHARESYGYLYSPAQIFWNGTTWKSFLKWRFNPNVYTCCIDTDWGVGIISKKHNIGTCIEPVNPFFEYLILERYRKEHLNLIDFNMLKSLLQH